MGGIGPSGAVGRAGACARLTPTAQVPTSRTSASRMPAFCQGDLSPRGFVLMTTPFPHPRDHAPLSPETHGMWRPAGALCSFPTLRGGTIARAETEVKTILGKHSGPKACQRSVVDRGNYVNTCCESVCATSHCLGKTLPELGKRV